MDENIKIRCDCGLAMIRRKCGDEYAGATECDYKTCKKREISVNDYLYHCPSKDHCIDFCEQCAEQSLIDLATEASNNSNNNNNNNNNNNDMINDVPSAPPENKKEIIDEDNMRVFCICSVQLFAIRPSEFTMSAVHCDCCQQVIPSNAKCYHCPNNAPNIHKQGYDLCLRCAKAQIEAQIEMYHNDDVNINDHKNNDDIIVVNDNENPNGNNNNNNKNNGNNNVNNIDSIIADLSTSQMLENENIGLKLEIRRLQQELANEKRKQSKVEQEYKSTSNTLRSITKNFVINKFNIRVNCQCQVPMLIVYPGDNYTSSTEAFCDNKDCKKIIYKNEPMFHCPTNKSNRHPNGFDYCFECGINKYFENNEPIQNVDSMKKKLKQYQELVTPILKLILECESKGDMIKRNPLPILNEMVSLAETEEKVFQLMTETFEAWKDDGSNEEKKEKKESSDELDKKYPLSKLKEMIYSLSKLQLSHMNDAKLLESLSDTLTNHYENELKFWRKWNDNEAAEWIYSLFSDKKWFEKYRVCIGKTLKEMNFNSKEMENIPLILKSQLTQEFSQCKNEIDEIESVLNQEIKKMVGLKDENENENEDEDNDEPPLFNPFEQAMNDNDASSNKEKVGKNQQNDKMQLESGSEDDDGDDDGDDDAAEWAVVHT